jgi:hypothetical protein
MHAYVYMQCQTHRRRKMEQLGESLVVAVMPVLLLVAQEVAVGLVGVI